jgi:hypothetical protein
MATKIDLAGSSTDLHRMIPGAMEGRDKQQLAYHASATNYASLMCSSDMKMHAKEVPIALPIFI